MGDAVEVMLRQVMKALMTDDRALVGEVSRMDNTVDRLDEAIKLYVTKLTRGSLDDREGNRAMEIISFAINLEHIGDIIDKNLCELAAKKIKRKIQFSAEGGAELAAFHKRIHDSLRLAFSVFMSGDVSEARKLISEKAQVRNAELSGPSAISNACAKAGLNRSKRPHSTWTSCATSREFTLTSAQLPTQSLKPLARGMRAT
jgi:phosphate:Na+ symporter